MQKQKKAGQGDAQDEDDDIITGTLEIPDVEDVLQEVEEALAEESDEQFGCGCGW